MFLRSSAGNASRDALRHKSAQRRSLKTGRRASRKGITTRSVGTRISVSSAHLYRSTDLNKSNKRLQAMRTRTMEGAASLVTRPASVSLS
ncbi:DUF1534 domain-containing protein [Pseudomonas syringae pv. actinidiae]|nr:DUF1534 domain-containing protein [Pseudomonas syringae pv. actinidiae]